MQADVDLCEKSISSNHIPLSDTHCFKGVRTTFPRIQSFAQF